MNVLFICGKARMRSPTAAQLVTGWDGIAADYAGLSNDADEKLSAEQVEWADTICVMEQRQKKRLKALFGPLLKAKHVAVLGIPDSFGYMDSELARLLEQKLKLLLRR